ncbi:MAG: ferritin-like domain-containing protein [Labilithrix sp.]|nr:ferritin-like domain-containing protein [Labilithrix sp.]MCW5816603.1 ferritin-like domain-containing protein [Labilithrix sp.]
MDVARFRRLISHLLASPVVLAACGGSVTEMPERAVCIDPSSADRYAALSLGPNVDGIAFATRPYDAPSTTARTRLPSLGAPCSKATDRTACEARASALLVTEEAEEAEGWPVNGAVCGDRASRGAALACSASANDVAVITSGDDVRRASLDDVRRAVSPVETLDEAIALLILQGGNVDCNDANARSESDGWTFKHTVHYCSGRVTESFTKVSREGMLSDAGQNVVEEADNGCIEGRRPAGLRPTGSPWLSAVGPCLAEIAYMEAAAVHAFADLAARLRELGAPRALIERAEEARRDEVRHAALARELAARHGGEVKTPVVAHAAAPGDALAFAIENAVEGCVREAFGAVVSAFQAANAADPRIRTAFASIARDEARHAELAFAIDGWLAARLDAAARRAVAVAMDDAWDALAAELAELAEPAEEVRRVAGYPTLVEQCALLAALRDVAAAA